jgi:crotonobetaine/carnitine-CoA ligase
MLTHVIKDSGARTAVIEEKYLDRFLECADGMVDKVVVRPGPGTSLRTYASASGPMIIGFSHLTDSAPAGPAPVEPWDLMAVLYTSGTTGNSKGVLIPHAALHGAAEQAGNVSAGDVRFVVVPLFHYSGQCGSVYRAFIAGATAYIAAGFSASRFWDEARAAKATSTLLMSTMPDFLMRQEPSPKDTEHTMHEVFMVPVLKDVAGFRRRFKVARIVSAYGSTESQGPLCDNDGTLARPGRVGRPWELMEFRLVDENDIEVPDGQVGEGVVRSRQPWLLSPGYAGLTEASLKMWRNGWLHTGDAFYRDQEGSYHFVDRLVDHIRRRGENISSAEVEREVESHPDVAEAAAVAVPSEFTEDEIKVVVLRREGADLTEEQLTRYLIDRMPYFMVPRYVEFVTEFPRTPTLKIRKNVLRAAGTDAAWDREAAGIKVNR